MDDKWWLERVEQTFGYAGDYYYTNYPDYTPVGNWARWEFEVYPGSEYEVYVSWGGLSNRTVSAPYTVYDDTTALDTVLVNQRQPGDRQLGWEKIGTYAIGTSRLIVELTDAGTEDGAVIADAVRVVRV